MNHDVLNPRKACARLAWSTHPSRKPNFNSPTSFLVYGKHQENLVTLCLPLSSQAYDRVVVCALHVGCEIFTDKFQGQNGTYCRILKHGRRDI